MNPMTDLTVGEYAALAEPIIKGLGKAVGIPEPKAVELYGRLVGMLDNTLPSLHECKTRIAYIKSKRIEDMDQTEIRVGFLCGFVIPKHKPFVAPSSAQVGRNEPCPCKSGLKFKNCCLSEAKKWDSKQLAERHDPFLGEK